MSDPRAPGPVQQNWLHDRYTGATRPPGTQGDMVYDLVNDYWNIGNPRYSRWVSTWERSYTFGEDVAITNAYALMDTGSRPGTLYGYLVPWSLLVTRILVTINNLTTSTATVEIRSTGVVRGSTTIGGSWFHDSGDVGIVIPAGTIWSVYVNGTINDDHVIDVWVRRNGGTYP
jgi:hypothetical protein